MLKIGEVANILDIPIKTIRYWEEFGLFKPSYIDRYTGYRQFDEKDIERLAQIVYLKQLGFTLKEIKNFDDSVIKQKSVELQKLSATIKDNIYKVSSLQKNSKGEYIMKNFINDKTAIGHWTLLGLAETEDDAKLQKFNKNLGKYYHVKDMYLMENGEKYWVLGWTKGAILINDTKNPYTIVDDNMIVAITNDEQVECYAMYKRVDSISHKLEDFEIKDNINIPFVLDKKALGVWQYYDFIHDPKTFNPTKKESHSDDSYIRQLSILDNGDVIFEFRGNQLEKFKWTKDHILNDVDSLDSKYKIVKDASDSYLIWEWKSGDYMYGGYIWGYYVFKKFIGR